MEKSSSCAARNECTGVTVYEEGGGEGACLDGSSTESPDYSDAEDQSWHSPYTSHGGGNFDDDDDDDNDDDDCDGSSDLEIPGPGAASDLPRHFMSDNSDVDLEKGSDEVKTANPSVATQQHQGSEVEVEPSGSRSEKECRICHLGLEVSSHEAGTSIVLGCACKHDLAIAHKQCAEAWFKIKGNRTCEICGSTARNVVGVEDTDFMEHWNEGSTVIPAPSEPRNFWRGHRFLNFLLACMVFAFVISWLFHFNIPS